MFRRLVTLGILAAIVYYGYTVGLPWWRAQQAGREAEQAENAEAQEAVHCVGLASEANRTLTSELRQFDRPPVDLGLWTAALIHIGSQLSKADDVCVCPAEACRKAAQALREMRELVDQLDGIARGYAPGISNPATRQERILSLLDEARTLSRL